MPWPANYVPLSPISFLERAAAVYGRRTSIVYGGVRFSWTETYERCLQLAAGLIHVGLSPGETVAALAPNIPALYELHFAVPMAGAVLSPLNPKLDAPTLASLLQLLEPNLIFVDYQFWHLVLEALTVLYQKSPSLPQIVLIPELNKPSYPMAEHNPTADQLHYDEILRMGGMKIGDFRIIGPKDESDPISVSFTSGSTGTPKGVLYSHRATFLNSLAAISRYEMKDDGTKFLWTLDMFRCNGWCLPWAVAAVGGTNICPRSVTSSVIFDSINVHNVTLLCGAPSVLNMIALAPETDYRKSVSHTVHVIIAGVLPFSQVTKVQQLGFEVHHAYGMTEAVGPIIVRPWNCGLNNPLSLNENEEINFAVGLRNVFVHGVDVKDPETMKSTPCDGTTFGEVMFKGNTLMLGYLKNPKATQEAFKDGWFRTGDLGVIHPNGQIQMKDRARDIVKTGGRMVSTLEVEAVLLGHPKVLEAAVVGKDDDVLGQVPCAFVKLKVGVDATEEEIVVFCEKELPGFMVPQKVVFGDLPVNCTGKVQKSLLRTRANAFAATNTQSSLNLF